MSQWHSKHLRQVLDELESSPLGLSAAQAREQLRRHGPNRLE